MKTLQCSYFARSPDSIIGTVSGLWAAISRTLFLRDKRFFSSPEHPDQLWGPTRLLFNGCKVLSPDIKQPRLTALPCSHYVACNG